MLMTLNLMTNHDADISTNNNTNLPYILMYLIVMHVHSVFKEK